MALAIRRKNDPGAKLISDRSYYMVICAVLLLGFLVNAVEVVFFYEQIASIDPVIFFIVYFVCALAGICMSSFSTNAVVSFVGYLLVVTPVGMALALCVPAAGAMAVRSAFLSTAILSAIMCVLAVVYPKFFHSLLALLSLALLVAVVYELVSLLAGFSTGVWYDWLVVLLFSCYVGADLSFARSRPRTLDCAVDSACGLYLDIINIFIRLLAIFSRRK